MKYGRFSLFMTIEFSKGVDSIVWGFIRMYIYKYPDLNYTLKSESGKVLKRDGMIESRKMGNTEILP